MLDTALFRVSDLQRSAPASDGHDQQPVHRECIRVGLNSLPSAPNRYFNLFSDIVLEKHYKSVSPN